MLLCICSVWIYVMQLVVAINAYTPTDPTGESLYDNLVQAGGAHYKFKDVDDSDIHIICVYGVMKEAWGACRNNAFSFPCIFPQNYWYFQSSFVDPNFQPGDIAEGQDEQDRTTMHSRWYCRRRRDMSFFHLSTPNDLYLLFNEPWNAVSDNRDVDVICNYQTSYTALYGKEYVCMETSTNRILGTTDWPSGIIMIHSKTPKSASCDNTITNSACVNLDDRVMLLHYHKYTASPSPGPVCDLICYWSDTFTCDDTTVYSTQPTRTVDQSVPVRHIVTTAYSCTDTSSTTPYKIPHTTGSNNLMGARSTCYNNCTHVLYQESSIQPGTRIYTYKPGAYVPLIQHNAPSFYTVNPQTSSTDNSGTEDYTSFVADFLACKTPLSDQALYRLVAYASLPYRKLVLSPINVGFGTTTLAYTIPDPYFNDPASFISPWNTDSVFRPYVEAHGFGTDGSARTNQIRPFGMWWSKQQYDQCECKASNPLQRSYFNNDQQKPACVDPASLCTHCTCTESDTIIPASLRIGHRMVYQFFQAYNIRCYYDLSVPDDYYSEVSGISCTGEHRPNFEEPFIEGMTIYSYVGLRLSVNGKRARTTTCKCLENTGWIAPSCSQCDNARGWWGSSCDQTCRSPDGLFIGNSACRNGGSCLYNDVSKTTYCSCAPGFSGEFCLYPTTISTICSPDGPATLDIECTAVSAGGLVFSATYVCQTTHPASFALPQPEGGDPILYTLSAPLTTISLTPDASRDNPTNIWYNPILPVDNICPLLYRTLRNNTSNGAAGFNCPMPYNNLHPTSVDFRMWCLLDVNSAVRSFTFYNYTIYC
jgi:hypothetical protein